MKKTFILTYCIVLVMLLLCSCGTNEKTNGEKVSALTYCKEYDIDAINYKDIYDLENSLKELYPENEYIVFNNQYFFNIASRDKINGEIHTAQVYIFQTNNQAHDYFVWLLFHSNPQIYQLCTVRANNIVVTGFTDIAIMFLEHNSIKVPKERKVDSVAEKIIKNISVDTTKLEKYLSSDNYTTYLYEEDDSEKELSAYKMIVNKDGSSILVWFDKTYALELGDVFNVHFEMEKKQYAGKYVEYNNCAFIFLDDFWLDMIKQCEK